MARDFDGSTDAYRITGSPATLGWFSGSLWFYPTDDARDQMLFAEHNNASTAYFGVLLAGLTTDKVIFFTSADAGVSSGGTVNYNAWNHVYWSYNTYPATTRFQISLNGETLQTQNLTTPLGVAMTNTGIARRGGTGATEWFAGRLEHLALWPDVLDNYGDLWMALANRLCPLKVWGDYQSSGGTGGLIHYWPLIKNTNDIVGGRGWTAVGTPTLIDGTSINRTSRPRLVA